MDAIPRLRTSTLLLLLLLLSGHHSPAPVAQAALPLYIQAARPLKFPVPTTHNQKLHSAAAAGTYSPRSPKPESNRQSRLACAVHILNLIVFSLRRFLPIDRSSGVAEGIVVVFLAGNGGGWPGLLAGVGFLGRAAPGGRAAAAGLPDVDPAQGAAPAGPEIGRASCREREYLFV